MYNIDYRVFVCWKFLKKIFTTELWVSQVKIYYYALNCVFKNILYIYIYMCGYDIPI